MTCLQHLRSDTSSAQGLLTVLTESLTEMRRQQLAGGGEQAGGEGLQQWNRGKSYGDVLFGLKNMSGERDEVRVLRIVVPSNRYDVICVVELSVHAMSYCC